MAGELRRLRELSALETDWDTYGSPPPSSSALATARQLLLAVAERRGERGRPRAILALTGGGVQLDWGDPAHKLSVEIGPESHLAYLLVDRRRGARRSEERDEASWSDVLEQVDRLLDR
jgi:hypothetical protein